MICYSLQYPINNELMQIATVQSMYHGTTPEYFCTHFFQHVLHLKMQFIIIKIILSHDCSYQLKAKGQVHSKIHVLTPLSLQTCMTCLVPWNKKVRISEELSWRFSIIPWLSSSKNTISRIIKVAHVPDLLYILQVF